MLSKKQLAQLRSLAQTTKAMYNVGKNEINENVLSMLDKALTKHELIKISVNKAMSDEKEEFAHELSTLLHAELVTIIGRVIVLYRKNLKNPRIELVM